MTLDGIDVSAYQATTPDLTGQAFLFGRATYGTAIDSRYAMHRNNARAARLVVGAYHFGRSANAAPIATQAAVFLGAAGDVDLYVLDLESDGDAVGMTNAEASDFIAAVQAAGKRCGLYHSESGYPQLGQDWNWVAKWSANPPTIPWDFWQWQGSPLDRDRFAGDAAALAALIRGGSMPRITALSSFSGSVTVNDVPGGVSAVRADGQFVPVAAGAGFSVVGKGVIDTPIAGEVYLVNPNDELHYLRSAEVTAHPDPVVDCSGVQAELDAANAKLDVVRKTVAV